MGLFSDLLKIISKIFLGSSEGNTRFLNVLERASRHYDWALKYKTTKDLIVAASLLKDVDDNLAGSNADIMRKYILLAKVQSKLAEFFLEEGKTKLAKKQEELSTELPQDPMKLEAELSNVRHQIEENEKYLEELYKMPVNRKTDKKISELKTQNESLRIKERQLTEALNKAKESIQTKTQVMGEYQQKILILLEDIITAVGELENIEGLPPSEEEEKRKFLQEIRQKMEEIKNESAKLS